MIIGNAKIASSANAMVGNTESFQVLGKAAKLIIARTKMFTNAQEMIL